jgi:hypothetical protein
MHDGMDLDPSVPEEILGPYPGLLQHWQATVFARDAVKKLGSGGVKRYYSPAYLHAVVRQHWWLTKGPGECPDPALAARCEAIASTYPGLPSDADASSTTLGGVRCRHHAMSTSADTRPCSPRADAQSVA